MPSEKKKLSNLNHKVFQNELILEQIFQNIEIKNLLQFRLVCRKWKLLIDPIISEEITIVFNPHKSIPKQIDIFQKLKLSKVTFAMDAMESETAELVVNTLANNWSQVKFLHIQRIDVSAKNGRKKLSTLLSSLKNLQVLKSSVIDFPKFLQKTRNNDVYPNIRFLEMETQWFGPYDYAEVAQKVSKNFTNLEQCLGDVNLDSELLKLIRDGKVSGRKIKSFHTKGYNGFQWESLGLAELKKTPVNVLPFLRKLEIGELQEFEQKGANLLTEVLKQFAGTLEIVKLLTSMKGQWPIEQFIVNIPPLPKVRELVVGLPPFEDEPIFLWNLGNSIAKDFPLLEYFILKPSFDCFCEEEGTEEDCDHFVECHYPFNRDCVKIWEPFVPYNREETEVDLSPLKFLKFVDLSIPSTWTGGEEYKGWGERFLDVYLKLYGNGGRETVQNMIDWLN